MSSLGEARGPKPELERSQQVFGVYVEQNSLVHRDERRCHRRHPVSEPRCDEGFLKNVGFVYSVINLTTML